MRDYVVLAIVYGALPFIPFRPFVGLCVFSWLAYMRPQDLAWGLGAHKLSQYVMLATVLGIVLHVLFPGTLGKEKVSRFHLITLLLVTLGLWSAITAQTAVDPALTRAGGFDYMNFEKTLFLGLLTIGLVGTAARFRLLLGVIAFSLGLLGFKYGLFGVLRGGAQIIYGPGGFMIGRNTFAVALNMAIPLLMAISITDSSKIVRKAALALIPFSALAIVFTFSRGGLLTLAVVGFVLVLRAGRPILASFALMAVASMFFVVSTDAFREQYFGRVSTVGEYQEDESAMGRIREWKAALRIAGDYPVFGVGPNNIRTVYVHYRDDVADLSGPTRGSEGESYLVSHNSFLQILVDSGIPALALLLTLIVVSLWRLQKLQGSRWPSSIQSWARAFQLSIAAWMLGGMLLNMAYFDLIYHLFALTACLEIVARSEGAQVPVLSIVTPDEIPWWRRQPAA